MYTLYIGNKNYSSWSLRAWLETRQSVVERRGVFVQLRGTYDPDFRASRHGLVPALHDGESTSGIRSRSASTSPSGIPACGRPIGRACVGA